MHRCLAPLSAVLLFISSLALASTLPAQDDDAGTLLLRMPAISADHLAFIYAGDLWLAARDGSSPRRLTVHPGVESGPYFSPDGAWIAFTGEYGGNDDVYVVSVDGGQPRRLTWHPESDTVRGWSQDGRVLFDSARRGFKGSLSRLYLIGLDEGLPQPLPLPWGFHSSFSPDGSRLAYQQLPNPANGPWKRHRGGLMPPIWLLDLESYEVEKVPAAESNNTHPVWLGDTVYFLSDREYTVNIFAYGTGSRDLRQLTQHEGYDVGWLNGHGEHLIYEQAGRLHEFDLASGSSRPLVVHVAPDLPSTRSRWVPAAPYLQNGSLSPSGARAVFSARGEIVSVPADKGSVRNVTQAPGSHERFPAWSPDGRYLAYLSDASGEYRLVIQDLSGEQEERSLALSAEPTYYYQPRWSPDGSKILYTDKHRRIFVLDVETAGALPVEVDRDSYSHPVRGLDPSWSPDGRWVTYTKRLAHHLRAVFVYELASGERHQVTDGRSDASHAVFSRDGKYLYFTLSAEYGLNAAWLDMSSFDRPENRGLYLAVLSNEEPSPLAIESDEEPIREAEGEDEGKEGSEKGADKPSKDGELPQVRIDLEDLDQRILPLPVPPGAYLDLQVAADGALFYRRSDQVVADATNGGTFELVRFDLGEREGTTFRAGVSSYSLSGDGKKALLQLENGGGWVIAETAGKPDNGEKLKVGSAQIYIEPRAEWPQMLHEAWRIHRDFFYDADMHGLDWPAMLKRYEPFLEHVGHRSDMTYLLSELAAELVVGHAYVGGGDMPDEDEPAVGLLGADFELDTEAGAGHYRLVDILRGNTWNSLRAPLREPGIDVREGDYLLAVNGRPLQAPTNPHSLFVGTANQVTTLTVNDRPSLEGAREVRVRPVPSDNSLRMLAWVTDNYNRVEKLSDGRIAYIHVPNTSWQGYSFFNRYYFSQLDRDATLVDERFNSGGFVADYLIDLLDRPLLSYWATRDGAIFHTPLGSIPGPKAMVINQFASSGGDALPYMFRRRQLGKIIGKNTWGGLVGIFDYPALIDGGYTNSPRVAIFSLEGEWVVENEGVAPDIEVELMPADFMAGRDPQLEKAVEVLLEELAANPVEHRTEPPPPSRRAVQR